MTQTVNEKDVRQLVNEIIDESNSPNAYFYNKEDKDISDRIDEIEYELAKMRNELYDIYCDLGKDVADNKCVSDNGKLLITMCENLKSKINALEEEKKPLWDKRLYYTKLYLEKRWGNYGN